MGFPFLFNFGCLAVEAAAAEPSVVVLCDDFLLGQNVKIMKNVGRDAPPSLKMELASYVHWHTAYQMSINPIINA